MYEATPVRGGERLAHTAKDEEGFRRRQRQARGEAMAQCLALEQFHDQEWPPVVVDAEVVDPHDVRVREAAAARASCRNLASTWPGAAPSAVPARSSRMTLTATFRSSTPSGAS